MKKAIIILAVLLLVCLGAWAIFKKKKKKVGKVIVGPIDKGDYGPAPTPPELIPDSQD